MSFQDLQLHPIIVRNLEAMGYHQPRPIQVQAIGPILAGRDMVGLAEAGSGKTAAFVTPLAHQLLSLKPPQVRGRPIEPMSRLRAIVLEPTRELARQVADEAAAIMQGSALRVACAYGKVAMTPQVQAIGRGVDLLVATPGRMRELLEAGALSLAYVKHVVIDEADRMLDMGFLPQVQSILQGIPAERQTMLFTATMPQPIEELAAGFLRDPVRIEIGRHTTPVQHVHQRLIPVAEADKVPMLLHMFGDARRRGALVFCRTRRRVGWVGTALERNNIKVGMLHGDRSQAQRQKALDRFANGELHVLVVTDVAARGLHIPAVRTVVNYDVPITPEEYVHRIGRAAHGGDGAGEAYTFLAEHERMRWRAILNTTGVEVFAESLEGFAPTVDVRRKPRTPRDEDERPISRRALKRQLRGKRKSKKSRPIKKGQKPGKGVVRPGGKR